jgi:hypothetical protein
MQRHGRNFRIRGRARVRFAECKQMPGCPQVKAAIDDGGRGNHRFVQRVAGEHLQRVAGAIEDRHARLRTRANLPRRGNRRGVGIDQRAQAFLPVQHLACLRVQTGGQAAILHKIEPPPVAER